MKWVLFVIMVVAMFALYVRLAPTHLDNWHRFSAPKPVGDYPETGGFERRVIVAGDAAEAMQTLDRIALATPRTKRLVGSVEDGFVTYETRSKLWGFPDYTSAYLTRHDPQAEGQTTLTVYGRLRFGKSDMGVNRARIEGWFAAMPPGLLQTGGE